MTGAADEHDEVRRRLRALRVFEGELPRFDVERAPELPAELFWQWLAEAIETGVREPHTMTLSTVDADGRPNARVLILKGLDGGRWQFASNADSPKGRELTANPAAAASFHWRELGRQVRIRGRVSDAGADAGARDFLARAPGGRAEALAGHQSEPLDRLDHPERAVIEARARIDADPQLVAPRWTLYDLAAEEVEFWQADRDRQHTRLRYRLVAERWTRTMLWP